VRGAARRCGSGRTQTRRKLIFRRSLLAGLGGTIDRVRQYRCREDKTHVVPSRVPGTAAHRGRKDLGTGIPKS
jgi:hypothetical protein